MIIEFSPAEYLPWVFTVNQALSALSQIKVREAFYYANRDMKL
jgi:hypothetical protein